MTAAASPAGVMIGGVVYHDLDLDGAADVILGELRAGRGGRAVTPNVAIHRVASASPALLDLVRTADLVLADGMPIVWASKLGGAPLPGRVPGSELAPMLVRRLAEDPQGAGVYLLGGPPGSAERVAARLRAESPGLRTGWDCPPMGFEKHEGALADIECRVEAFGPALCLVGLGFPKQDLLGRRLVAAFPRSWFIGVGATIAFMAGDVARAPAWMQRSGLEWTHRLAREPSRLAGRYARDVPFAIDLLWGALRSGQRGGRS